MDNYRNSDGTINVYQLDRPLNCKGGQVSYDKSSGIGHRAFALGNRDRFLISDYGTAYFKSPQNTP